MGLVVQSRIQGNEEKALYPCQTQCFLKTKICCKRAGIGREEQFCTIHLCFHPIFNSIINM